MSLAGGSRVDRAMQAVRAHIRAHDLKVGDTLPGEGRFATELGVSRAVMREAFGALAALRQIDVANGRRAKVGAIDGSVMASSIDHAVATAQISFADIWDVRRTVELRVAALAARNRTDMEAEELLRLATAMRAAAEADEMTRVVEHDIALHQAIAQASGNPLFAQMVRSYAVPLRQAVPQAWQTRRTRDETDAMLDRHYEIARTIADRDVDAAIAAMTGHFDASIEDLLR